MRQLVAPREELLDQGDLLGRDHAAGQSKRLARAALFHARGPGCAAGALVGEGEFLHYDIGSSQHVAEPTTERIEVHYDSTQQIAGWWQHIGGAHQVAQRSFAKSDGQPILANDANAHALFSRCRSLPKAFEE